MERFFSPICFQKIQRGKRLKKADHIPGIIPYVSSTANNNGVDDYIEAIEGTRVFEKCISLANSGSVGTAFYEPFAFVASDHVTSLKRENTSQYVYLFLTAVLEQQGSNFNFNREINDLRIRKMRIMLPVDDNDEPDYEFMEDYMKELMSVKRKQYQKYVEQRLTELGIDDVKNTEAWRYKVSFGDREWKDISITSIFDKIKTGNINNASLLKKTSEYGIEYIGATNKNNGCLYFVESNDRTNNLLQDGNCIGFIKDGDGSAGYSIYKRESFVSTVNVIYGYANWLNEYTGLFFVTAQDLIKSKYSHGYKRNQQHLRGDRVMLPVNDNDEPDYEFMEECGRKMMAKKYKQYLAFLEKTMDAKPKKGWKTLNIKIQNHV